ncbi:MULTISPECIES: gamma carbonic anhydrase family protein [Pseudonocardia]|uniref:2,3,4,5-tetrahydropyridine-2,6-dicarboxylate N-acetyltransferase n=2 Tax=Pseudonocardia TaxID=1847 RepID=A0A1Y2N6P0_PSEAH|nr:MULTISPECIES: gamma carbonic anhydrase family protein [Pseudonocardia]OSY42839.1 2,3,4,5-tetrahydropyridine-2,6-dicarboxylate N-acetyltransferase [Pseudonocardia autotrophica]TDN77416.1 carbonic anhydrase/acetyltransferase-like protein (isoleucine patch superfamily) [Pseudonocardia autotrophica]BBG01440.1 gamma carbonic anhydrase family protein [Pseudonocardia autotrophica]GEC24497.1 gamma carbonic anhydrase family protein [Pseudonocardia saturnea]
MIEINGQRPDVHADAWIAPGAVLAGEVRIGPETGVWYTCVLRADMASITVGARSNVQDGTVVHADPGFPVTIGDRVTIGHRAVVHGCTIGDDVLVGMGAVLMNGVQVGAGSLIAAGAVLTQGTVVPPGSLVAGLPGKVRRELTDDERNSIPLSAASYVHLLGQHRAAAL